PCHHVSLTPLSPYTVLSLFQTAGHLRDLHSFPTRRSSDLGGRTSSWNPHCSPPASASQRARPCWAMGGSCSATATPASCWPMPTAPFPPSPAPAAHRGAPCSARTAPST